MEDPVKMKKTPHPVDEYVGMKLRWLRSKRKMSQERLGDQLGVTFQQVQKYEKGSNRVSASRLFEIARILEVDVAYFFDGFSQSANGTPDVSTDANPPPVPVDFLRTHEGIKLITAFTSIENPKLRKSVVDHVEALAKQVSD